MRHSLPRAVSFLSSLTEQKRRANARERERERERERGRGREYEKGREGGRKGRRS
jgi:hypothetical protein